ncbi:uncharacterized protein ARMOST_07515 [Armillaria ostoyae]|uniref:Uncharacterized protein n=1 Tax=Armillaria ostoyae TaxID=47428 RepID=A0A284R618_ARMOS|nr:uncharacterized protein ARMOST_07515 [Armillaria ostoyae]
MDNEILFFAQISLDLKDPEPQVMAEAIRVAAYATKNKIRVGSLHLPPLQDIAMVGTSPIFYKVTVAADLSNAVQQGTYSQAVSFVSREQSRDFDVLGGIQTILGKLNQGRSESRFCGDSEDDSELDYARCCSVNLTVETAKGASSDVISGADQNRTQNRAIRIAMLV